MYKERKKRIALITGAASPIGRAIALGCASQGMEVITHYHRGAAPARALAREIERQGSRAWLMRADLRNDRECMTLVRSAKKLAGRLDVLVNNASIFPQSALHDMTAKHFAAVMRLNAWAPMVLCREFVKAAKHGAIVNLLDSRIVGSDPGHAGYMLSKHALAEATRIMALEYAPGIRVNAVAPGLILTRAGHAKAYRRLSRFLPVRRYGNPVDVARAVLFLVQSEFVTGQCIFVDGGRMAREKCKMQNEE
ncbi:MAG: SDR family oxidoreductase [Chitinispirillaceae bacterium]|nr:SDR family oxidoreductase [Chitinispirillaceae bacterium]